ncbi:uncharacterized protein LOC111087196 [Limulus polyphemus]|uniref:Uncharacterized protein LOC111087196 n=1 Tax=Limulus polyphemus TaxID=6850 RepID=A0ABM1SYN1_LIMPO|nr:uncharacterized protein LOC111087196 [Limulus polyphemus]
MVSLAITLHVFLQLCFIGLMLIDSSMLQLVGQWNSKFNPNPWIANHPPIRVQEPETTKRSKHNNILETTGVNSSSIIDNNNTTNGILKQDFVEDPYLKFGLAEDKLSLSTSFSNPFQVTEIAPDGGGMFHDSLDSSGLTLKQAFLESLNLQQQPGRIPQGNQSPMFITDDTIPENFPQANGVVFPGVVSYGDSVFQQRPFIQRYGFPFPTNSHDGGFIPPFRPLRHGSVIASPFLGLRTGSLAPGGSFYPSKTPSSNKLVLSAASIQENPQLAPEVNQGIAPFGQISPFGHSVPKLLGIQSSQPNLGPLRATQLGTMRYFSPWLRGRGIPLNGGFLYNREVPLQFNHFRCENYDLPGHYADIEAGCQVFHLCDVEKRHTVFMCPPGTLFNQPLQACDWAYRVRCASSARFFKFKRTSCQGNI